VAATGGAIGGDPHIVAPDDRVNAHPMTIIGITPAEFPGIRDWHVTRHSACQFVMQAEMLGSASRLGEPARVVGADRRTSASVLSARDFFSGGRSLVTANAAHRNSMRIFQRSLAAIRATCLRNVTCSCATARGDAVAAEPFAAPLGVLSALAAAVLLSCA